jgi:hypothetical protein
MISIGRRFPPNPRNQLNVEVTMNAYAYRTMVRAKSLKAPYGEAANQARYSVSLETAEEAAAARWVKALTFARCVLGPLALFVLLLCTVQWGGSQTAATSAAPAPSPELKRATAVFKSFHEQFAMTSGQDAAAHIEAF